LALYARVVSMYSLRSLSTSETATGFGLGLRGVDFFCAKTTAGVITSSIRTTAGIRIRFSIDGHIYLFDSANIGPRCVTHFGAQMLRGYFASGGIAAVFPFRNRSNQ